MSEAPAPRVLLIGWDGADWRFIEPLIERGLLPTLAAFRARGAWGNLATLQPALSPMLWTSIATGKRPTKHGVLGFTEVAPDGAAVRPASSTSRRVKALWNILSQTGRRSLVGGFLATQPAEPIRGVMVADGFETPVAKLGEPWPIPPGAVHPSERAVGLAELRVHPAELDATALLPFVPRAAEIEAANDPRLARLATLLAQTVSLHAIATRLLETEPWDFAAFCYEGIDRFGHHFMNFHPPVRPGVPLREVELYGEVMTGCYRFHDMMLERLLQLAGPGATVLLVSDHGYFHDQRRPAPDAEPLEWHRPLGLACAAGPGVKAGARLFGATVLDVAPTVLALFGLPAAFDMDGRPWQEILTSPAQAPIASWESVAGMDGRHAVDRMHDPMTSAAALQQLVALGYIDPLPEDTALAVRQTADVAMHHLALAHFDANEPIEAAALFRTLLERHPEDESIRLKLAIATAASGDGAAARALVLPLTESATAKVRAWLLLGRLELAEGNAAGALKWLRRCEQSTPDAPEVLLRLGHALVQAKSPEEAKSVFGRLLERDAESAAAHDGMASAWLALNQPAEALKSALRATELAYFLPRAHFHTGQALAALREYPAAIQALEVCLSQAGNHVPAGELLADLLRRVGRPAEATTVAIRVSALKASARAGAH